MTTKISMLAIDLAKGSFQVCAVGADGAVLYNRALSRTRLATLLCRAAGLHGGDGGLCHVASLGPGGAVGTAMRSVWCRRRYVKPFVKRQKNDRADAEAIAEAALRPTMRFVAVKSAETQGRASSSLEPWRPMDAFRTHQCLVRQSTQLINALRGHLAEFGLVAPKGPASLKVLEHALADETSDLPGPVREMGTVYLDQIAQLTEVVERLAENWRRPRRQTRSCDGSAPYRGSAPSPQAPSRLSRRTSDTFDSGRNFAAWLGLVPRQRSTGGKTKLGSVSKMGQTDIRRLLIVGAMSVIRWVVRKGGSPNRWLAALVARKPKMVAAVALANKMARMIWAVTTKQEDYRMA